MTENNPIRDLITRPTSAIDVNSVGAKRINAQMTEGVLDLIRKRNLTAPKIFHRIGSYEFCSPDYQQIMVWSNTLELTPEEVIAELELPVLVERPKLIAPCRFQVENGAIVSLAWDFNRLPLPEFGLIDGLQIRSLGFKGDFPKGEFNPATTLYDLEYLWCANTSLIKINVEKLPRLRRLICYKNKLDTLDLSGAPWLRELDCAWNQIKSLDIFSVPELIELNCMGNQLKELDVSSAYKLTELACAGNNLTKLDLAHAIPHNFRTLELSPC